MRIALLASTALALLAIHAAPALAQSETWSDSGRLEDSDAQTSDGNRYDDHAIRLEAGQRYRISVNSEEFDPVAQLRGAGTPDPVAENDDSDGLNPRINYTPTESGNYSLRVYGFSSDGRGAYSARVETLAPVPPPITTPGTPTTVTGTWLHWQGELSATDAETGGKHYDDYLMRFEAGQTRYISLEALGELDPMIQIVRADRRDSDPLEMIDGDDDTGVNVNSLLAFRAEEAGDYVIRVTSFGTGSTGAYRLWVSQ